MKSPIKAGQIGAVDPFARPHGFRMTRQTPKSEATPVEQPEPIGTNDRPVQESIVNKVVQKIPLAALIATSGSTLNEQNLAGLEESFRQVGQSNPILVALRPDGSFRIISGLRRVRAANTLGWKVIDALVLEASERDLELIGIAENHHRRATSVLERAISTARWSQVIVEGVQNGRPLGGKQPHELGINKTALSLGFSRTDVGRLLRIARLTPTAATAAVDLGLDNHQAALEKAAKFDDESEQLAVLHESAVRRKYSRNGRRAAPLVEHLKAKEPSSASLLPSVGLDDQLINRPDPDVQLNSLICLWNEFRCGLEGASQSSRERFCRDTLAVDGWFLDLLRAYSTGRSK